MRKSLFAPLALLLAGAASSWSYAQPGPTDPQIAHIFVTANQTDVDAGKVAAQRGSSRDVRAFGQQMVSDHQSVLKQTHALLQKQKITPEDNPTSADMKKDGDDNLAHLKPLKGKDFDKAYIDHEVTMHQSVIDAVDKTLLPSAKNDELKALIEKTRPALMHHLERAKQIQGKLGG